MRRACRSASRRRQRGAAKTKDPDTIALEKRVSDALGLTVTRQPSRSRRHRADQLPQPRTARRSDAAAARAAADGCSLSLAVFRIGGDREQRALRDRGGQRGLLAHVERRGRELIDDRRPAAPG